MSVKTPQSEPISQKSDILSDGKEARKSCRSKFCGGRGIITRLSARQEKADPPSSKKIHSLVFRDFSVLLLLCAAGLILFFFACTFHLLTSSENTRLDALESRLNAVSESMDALFQTELLEPMDDLHNALGAMVSSFDAADSDTLAQISSGLDSAASGSSLIADAFLYVPSANLVVSMSFEPCSLGDSLYYNIIWFQESGLVPSGELDLGSDPVYISNYDGQYVFSLPMYTGSEDRQSTLYLVLDKEQLLKYVNELLAPAIGISLYLYDGVGNQVTSQLYSAVNTQFDVSDDAMSTAQWSGKVNDLYIAGCRSEVSSFSLYLTAENAVKSDIADVAPTALFFTLVFFILICAILIPAVLFLYRPLRTSVSQLEQSGISVPADVKRKSTAGYLTDAIASILNQRENLQSTLQAVSDDVQRRILWQLLSENAVNYEATLSALDAIHSPFRPQAVYTVAALEYDPSAQQGNGSGDEICRILSECLSRLQKTGHDLSTELFPVKLGQWALVIQFNAPDISTVNGEHMMRTLRSQFLDEARNAGAVCCFESGHLYHSIFDICYSYQEALNAVADRKALSRPDADADVQSQQDRSFLTLIQHRADLILNACESENDGEAEAAIDFTLAEIQNTTDDSVQTVKISKELINLCITQIVSRYSINPSLIPDVYSEFCASVQPPCDQAQVIDSTRRSLLRLTAALSDLLHKLQSPHIVDTQEFIRQHYTNPDLTLDEIAQNTHLSSGYLSKLFSVSLGMKLFEYLTHFRVEASVDDLLNTDKSITEIAVGCGFSNIRNYIRAFKKYYGTPPGEWRKFHNPKKPSQSGDPDPQ